MSPRGMYQRTEEHRHKMSKAKKGKKCGPFTEEHKHNLSKSLMGRKLSEEHKRNVSKALKGKQNALGYKQPEEHKRNISAGKQGISLDEWNGYVAYEPYCHLFNFATKERVRNQYLRTCIITGESVFQEGRRLSIHHIDNNKQQGCNGIKWRLIPVTRSWNTKLMNKQDGLLLNLLLIKNPQAQINVGHG